MKTIVGRLQLSIFLAVLAVLGCIGIVAARLTLEKVDAFCDARLIHAAVTMDQLMALRPAGHDLATSPLANVPVLGPMGSTPTYEVEVGYRVLDGAHHDALTTENFRTLQGKAIAPTGFSDTHIAGKRWRLYRLDDAPTGRIVIVGERHDSRRDILRAVWMEHTLPLLLGLPLLGWLATWSVERVLAPLSRLAELLAKRPASSREAIVLDGSVARELTPLVASLNQYLFRANQALDREVRLSADVAHELRTPIAAAMINVDGALRHASANERERALPDAIEGIATLQVRSEELLTLATLDEANFTPSIPVDLSAVVDTVASEMAGDARLRGITITRNVTAGRWAVPGDEPALRAMLRNLVANALRHASRAGKVTIALQSDYERVVLSVTDDGPGIPAERREAVFQRFLRDTSLGDGFGLGLAIVHRVVHLHGATLTLRDGHDGRGLMVSIAFANTPKGAPH